MLHARKPDGSRLNVVVDADVQASTCGYCKSDADTSVSHGMVSLGMTVQVYQDLLDLGWRRSGCYLYKPDCTATCCPPYTIRMHANQFQVNKKQRQLQRKWQRFLAGEYDLPDPMHAKQQEQQQEEQQEEQQQQQQQVQRRHKAQRKRQQQQESQQQQQQHCPLGAGGCVDLVGHVEQLLAAAVQELVHEGRLPPVRVLLLPSGLHARAQAEYPAARLLPLKTKAKKSTISTPILWPLTSKLCEGDETRVSGSVTIDGSGVEQGASCHSSVTHQGPGARSEVACASVTKGRCKSNGGSTLDMEEQHWPRAGAGGAQGVAPATGWSCAITFAIAAVAAKAMRKGCQGRGHQLVQRVAPPPCYLHLVSQPPQQQQEQQQQQQEEEQQPQEQQEQQCWLHATPGEAVQGQSHQGRCSTATLPSCSKVVQSPAAGGGPGGAGAGGQLAVALAPPSPQDLACLLLTAMHHAVPVSQLVDTAGKVLVLLPLPGEVLPPESMQSPKQSGTLPGASHSPGLCVWASGGYLNIAPCLPSAQPHAQIARGSQTGTQQMDGAGLGGRPCTACPPASSCATLRRQGKGPRVSEAEHAPGTTSVPAAGAGAAAGVRAGAGAGDECEGQAVVTLSPLLVATPPVAQASSPPRNYEVLTLPSTFIEEEYQLYRRYQIQHHGDNPDDITRDSYTRFLVHTPLLPQGPSQSPTSAPAHTTSPLPCTGPTLTAATQTETPAPCAGSSGSGTSAAQGSSPAASDAPGCGFGSFHQQYRVDGQLVAVGVVDVLPRCLSGVYLFWDKAWAALAPGQWTALEEIRWVQEASRRCPSLQYYYMGYYIHTCPRMRYKADYQPADLLCPETKLWVRCDPDILEAIQQQPGAPLAHLPGALLSPNHAPLGWAAPVAAGTPSLATGQATGQPSGHTAAAGPSGTGTAADQAVQPAAAVSAAAGTGQGEQGLALDPGGTPSQSSQARPADSHNGSGTYHAPAAGASPVVGDKSLTKVKGGGVGRHRLVDGVPVSALDEVLLVVDTSAVTWQLAKQLGVVKPKHWALLDSLLAAWLRLVGGVAPQLGYKLS